MIKLEYDKNACRFGGYLIKKDRKKIELSMTELDQLWRKINAMVRGTNKIKRIK